jgi:hypothetical protein
VKEYLKEEDGGGGERREEEEEEEKEGRGGGEEEQEQENKKNYLLKFSIPPTKVSYSHDSMKANQTFDLLPLLLFFIVMMVIAFLKLTFLSFFSFIVATHSVG